MTSKPTEEALRQALGDAGSAHHDYESNYLNGTQDEHWAGWYAAYVVGRLGHFITPTELTRLLAEVSGEGSWSENAAAHVLSKL